MKYEMPALTDEQREELIFVSKEAIERYQEMIAHAESAALNNAVERLKIKLLRQQIALAALTAEPVAATEKHEISNMEATGLYLRAWPMDRRLNEQEGYTVQLYTAPPVPALKLPDEKESPFGTMDYDIYANDGWNDCIAEVKALNGVTK